MHASPLFVSISGDRIRTCDLRVMGPTSYQTALPRNQVIGNYIKRYCVGQSLFQVFLYFRRHPTHLALGIGLCRPILHETILGKAGDDVKMHMVDRLPRHSTIVAQAVVAVALRRFDDGGGDVAQYLTHGLQ